jgi:Dolichyl-phosphate-mannose-protein mannosyltransferase
MQEEVAAPEASRSSNLWWTLLALLVMGIGAAMRLRFYLYNRSMYRDEAALALNIVRRSFKGLLEPLDNNQGAPVGFLFLERFVVRLLGNHEYSLRLVPLSASILTLPLFYWLARQFLSRPFAVIALVFIAMSEKQYDYSADTKQYTFDVLVTVGLLCLAIKAVGNPLRQTAGSKNGMMALTIAGALAVWFAHPAVFVLGAIGVMAAMEWLARKPRSGTLDLLGLALVWLLSFAANYYFVLRRLSNNHFMQSFWTEAGGFAPIPTSIKALVWYKETFFETFETPGSMGFVGLSALVFVLGVGWLYRQRKSAALLVLLPAIFALAASMAHKYPFRERLILFICPSIAIFVGAGFAYLFEGRQKVVGIVALLFLLITPLNKTRGYIHQPWLHNDMRKIVSLVAANRQPGDHAYVYEICYYPYEYYSDRFGLGQMPVVRAKQVLDSVDAYKKEFAGFKGKRLWIMFESEPEQQLARGALDDMGSRVFEATAFDDYVACYELR